MIKNKGTKVVCLSVLEILGIIFIAGGLDMGNMLHAKLTVIIGIFMIGLTKAWGNSNVS
jgi:hypothetical protein